MKKRYVWGVAFSSTCNLVCEVSEGNGLGGPGFHRVLRASVVKIFSAGCY